MADSTKASQALEEFLALGKSAPGAAAVANIQKCIASPNCFVFAELLGLPHVQALQSDGDAEHAQWVEVLKLFAYGSYMDYKNKRRESPSSLPELTSAQLTKLKQLSLVTVASTDPSSLTYSSLQSLLDISTTRQLEDLVISAIYASLLDAKLDTASQRVEVSSVMGRDFAPGDITQMIAALSGWSSQCESVLSEIEQQIKAIQHQAVVQRKQQIQFEKQIEEKKRLLNSEKEFGGLGGPGKGKRGVERVDDFGGGYGGNGGNGGPGDDEMDLDDGPFDDHGSGRRSKRSQHMFRRKR